MQQQQQQELNPGYLGYPEPRSTTQHMKPFQHGQQPCLAHAMASGRCRTGSSLADEAGSGGPRARAPGSWACRPAAAFAEEERRELSGIPTPAFCRRQERPQLRFTRRCLTRGRASWEAVAAPLLTSPDPTPVPKPFPIPFSSKGRLST